MPHWLKRAAAFILIVLVSAIPLGIAALVVVQQVAYKTQVFHEDIASFVVNKIDKTIESAVIASVGLNPPVPFECNAQLLSRLNAMLQSQGGMREMRLTRPDRTTLCGITASAWEMGAESIELNGKSARLHPGYSSVPERQALIIRVQLSPLVVAESVLVLENTMLELLPPPVNAIVEFSIRATDGKFLFVDDRARFSVRNYANLSHKSGHETIVMRSAQFPYAASLTIDNQMLAQFLSPLAQLPYYLAGLLGLCLFMGLTRLYDQNYYTQKANTLEKRREAFEYAIENREFIPYYQPMIDLNTGIMVGAEVLMRWRKSDGRIISPLAFLEELEDEGYARRATVVMMQQVLAECGAAMQSQPNTRLSFNLFAAQFDGFTLVDDVVAIFGGSSVGYHQLVFEITEHRPLPDLIHAQRVVAELQRLGCKVSLDDVGIGASNLITLQELGVDQLKVDKQFVETIRRVDASSPIVDGLIHIAKKLKIEIVAEGIETRVQLQNLRKRGVHIVQGNLLSPALPATEFLSLMDAMNQTTPIKQPDWAHHMAV